MFGLRAIKDSSEHTGSYYAASRSPAFEYPPLTDAIECDVVVVGGGISGIIAAKTAAKNNFNTLLIDDKNILGGTTLFQENECFKINTSYSNEWLLSLIHI